MKRMQLFEVEDFSWFPDFLRQCMTAYLNALHRIFHTPELLAPLLLRLLHKHKTRQIMDLCSGSGGAMPTVARLLRESYHEPVQLTLSDLYPNKTVAQAVNASDQTWLRYEMKPVDAGQVTQDQPAVRTMICSFHHMPPPVAKKILTDAFQKRQPLCIFEVSDNSSPKALWWTAFPVGIILVLLVTLWVRPMTFRQLFFTYVIPILPLCIAWDGAASNARTYSESDLRDMLKDLTAPDYTWEIGTVRHRNNPGPMLYLLGQNA
ncbi:MAG TPA: hypothetical protein VE954_41620 [Oligoflexus sp.]|uniref:hypothetical protein n=1 Tax=Oligoflexus sp. TaxID=1971216 RepID=UPI002D6DE2FD|nr:hypothetical protein [Oligoflexus sp.]HYX39642.1 hypothetical protein [Oligoflexus sp.]